MTSRSGTYREFSLFKAGLLVGLLGLAAWMGDVPHAASDVAGDPNQPEILQILPVSGDASGKDCPKSTAITAPVSL